MNYQIIQGDNRQTLKQFPDNHFDSIVTDPPYGIDFLGKDWDATTGALETYQECLRVLKPGGHILAFSAARTYHHLAVTLEQAGFEIRDQIMWIYSSGFPKSQDVGRQLHKKLNGKPDKQRFDPSIMIRVEGDTYTHPETGKVYRALPDINGDRLAQAHEGERYGTVYEEVITVDSPWAGWGTQLKPAHEPIALARKPMSEKNTAENCLKWATGAVNIDATRVAYESLDDKMSIDHKVPTKAWSGHTLQTNSYEKDQFVQKETNELGRFPSNVIGEIPDYQKYFYCPKVSKRERHTNEHVENTHPTVKPVELMKYLIKLITPPGGHVLDPFNGSGSTGCAAVELGHTYTGLELDANYVDIAKARIEAWNKPENTFNDLFE